MYANSVWVSDIAMILCENKFDVEDPKLSSAERGSASPSRSRTP